MKLRAGTALLCLALVVMGCGSSESGPETRTSAQTSAKINASGGRDRSIQDYGAEATGSEAAALIAAMRSYFRALAAPDYAEVCADLISASRSRLSQLDRIRPKSCAGLAPRLLTAGSSSEAKRALAAPVIRVRVGGGNAFVLFRPSGGPVSYFVARREGTKWKATSLAAGTPLGP